MLPLPHVLSAAAVVVDTALAVPMLLPVLEVAVAVGADRAREAARPDRAQVEARAAVVAAGRPREAEVNKEQVRRGSANALPIAAALLLVALLAPLTVAEERLR